MEAVRHPNIVMFLGVCTKSPNYSIVLEYCGNGSLWSILQSPEIKLSWEERRRVSIEIARAILYLHMCNPPIIHRDLKSLNILLDENYHVKIADFGWTKMLAEYMSSKIGTYQWMAPEVIGTSNYSEKADTFSYGIILWEIASREPPYKSTPNLTQISRGKRCRTKC